MIATSMSGRAARPAPNADQDIERDQHRLVEDVEEKEVLGGEDAHGRAGEEEHEPEVRARPIAARPEPVGDRHRHDSQRQADEPERPVVESDLVGDAQVVEPDGRRLVLEPGHAVVEVRGGADPERELREGDEQGEAARLKPSPPGQKPEEKRGDQRGKDEEGGDHSAYLTEMKTTTITAAPAASASAYERRRPV
jgi:hypothetical protein